jgi:hypothetical protein
VSPDWVIRLIVQNLPIFQDVGWTVKNNLTVVATREDRGG